MKTEPTKILFDPALHHDFLAEWIPSLTQVKIKPDTTFYDSVNHLYYIAGRRVPSVTQIIRAILGDATWRASDWYMTRGAAVHAAAAMVAMGKRFDFDPQIEGQIEACKKFFKENKVSLFQVITVESQLYSAPHQFGGTVDMVCVFRDRETIVDWKSSLSPVAQLQVGGYSVLWPSATHGLVVALGEDGIPRLSDHFKLDQPRREFLALRSAYAVRQRLGLESATKTEGGNDGN